MALYRETADVVADPFKQEVQEKKKKKGGISGFLSSLISEAGGAGGAAGGAATGAAVGSIVPGIGTLLGGLAGAGIGGFLGGTGGRLVENKVRDNEFRLGDALEEGAISGVLSAVPIGGIAKGVKGLAKAGAKNVGEDVVEGGAKKIATEGGENFLSKFGGKLRAIPRGIEPGVDIGGGRNLSTAAAKAQNKALDKVATKGKGIGLSGQFTEAESEVANLVKTYKNSPESAKKISDKMIDDLLGRVESNIQANPSLRAAVRPGSKSGITRSTYEEVLKDLQSLRGKTAGDVAEYAPKINKLSKAIVERGNVGSKEVQVIDEVRDALTGFIDEALPDKSGLNKQISTLMGAMRQVGKSKTRDVGAGAGQGLTIGRMASNVANPAMDVAGRGSQFLGKMVGPTAGATANPTDLLSKGLMGREFVKQGIGGDLVGGEEQPAESAVPEDLSTTGGGELDLGGATQDTSPFSQETIQQAVLQDIQATGGQNIDKLLKLYEAFGQGDQLTAKQRDAQSKAQGLKGSIDLLARNFETAGSGQGGGGILASILGRTPGVRSLGLNEDAQVFEDQRKAMIAPLARAISGEVGVLTNQDISRAEGLLPRLSDPTDVAQVKLQDLYSLLGSSGGGSDLESLLSGASAGQ